ncbi:hypothetical protein LEP1GSC133_4832 [Leptospira borgpetersenii serovar Pomona str. 200901868]|uniref:Uncharacterized protein n=1 Tax=Leptospira borgpetersenii serovar Pomona str. 200901868 TaxID=1192866 RepID=M6WGE0_LEPBO|nr:hypothetical protein LEP1GSC133_4832 [Leptospira borgpetersenii serovar Pomona str. 200901868]
MNPHYGIFQQLYQSPSQNVGTIAAIREDSDKIEWFWDRHKFNPYGINQETIKVPFYF